MLKMHWRWLKFGSQLLKDLVLEFTLCTVPAPENAPVTALHTTHLTMYAACLTFILHLSHHPANILNLPEWHPKFAWQNEP